MSAELIAEWVDQYGLADCSDLHLIPDHHLYVVKHQQTTPDTSQRGVDASTVNGLAELLLPGGAESVRIGGAGQAFASFDMAADFRARVTFRQSLNGLMATCRLITRTIPTVEKLEVPAVVLDQAARPSGILLVAGPTNSGKSSMIAAIVNAIYKTNAVHITTIEEPIEFVYGKGVGLVTQREVGTHVSSYEAAIESAKGANPRVIVVGEIRNSAIAKAAVSAALSGHLVISTVHAGSVEDAIAAMIAYYPSDEQHLARVQLAQALRGVVVQSLVRKDGAGVTPDEHPLAVVREFASNDLAIASMIRGQTGGGDLHHVRQHMLGDGRKRGMFTKESSLAALVRSGKLTTGTARAQLTDPDRLDAALDRAAA